ncbi:MAG TPA: hypothetical protein VH107_02500, partial [Lacipirellulaceae bacterium]|nr:hypothetical protein [Lacipirellulaceae bacterium]
MKKLFLVCTIAFVVCALPAAAEEKPKSDVQEIPLKDVWAYRMPGTRNMKNLEPNAYGQNVCQLAMDEQDKREKESLNFQIIRCLSSENVNRPKPARPGFVVLGTDADALREAHGVLVDDHKAEHSFPAGSKLSLVFFAKAFNYGVGLDQLQRQGNKITIKYFFAPNITDPAPQFALIPLSDLPLGEIEVEKVRVPCPPKFNDPAYPAVEPKWDELVVCR